MKIDELDEFKKDLKGLLKKNKSLGEDLLVVRKVLMIMPDERPPFSCRIDHPSVVAKVIKVRKIACKSLKGKGVNSGLCLIYAFFKKDRRIVMVGLYDGKKDKQKEEAKIIMREFN